MLEKKTIIQNLFFIYSTLNRRVYQILRNESLSETENKNLVKQMFLISDGIHNLARYELLGINELKQESCLFEKVLNNLEFDEKYSQVFYSEINDMKSLVSRLKEIEE